MEWIIGIDLCDDYSQLSYFDLENNETRSLSLGSLSRFPTLLVPGGDGQLRAALTDDPGDIEEDAFYFLREDAEEYDRSSLIYTYLKALMDALDPSQGREIAYLTVSCPRRELWQDVYRAAARLAGREGRSVVQSHLLSYETYAMSQVSGVSPGDIGLFEYGEKGLFYTHLSLYRTVEGFQVEALSEDMRGELGPGSVSSLTGVDKDRQLLLALKRISPERKISSFYLTGNGFEDVGEGSSWMQESLAGLCSGRRHVFVGQNLYVRGAVLHSLYTLYPARSPRFTSLNTELSIYNIFMVSHGNGGRNVMTLLPAGCSRPFAWSKADILMADGDAINIYIENILTSDISLFSFRPDFLPDREGRSIRLSITLEYSGDDSCRVEARDTGFGDMFRSTGGKSLQEFEIKELPAGDPAGEKKGIRGAAPFAGAPLTMKLSGLRVFSTDELSRYIYENIYMIQDDILDERLFDWLDQKTGGRALSDSVRRAAAGNRGLQEPLRIMLESFAYLSPGEISSVCAGMEKLGRMPLMEKYRVKADGLSSYGRHLDALRLYHYAASHMEDDESGVDDEYRAAIWHNMAVCLMALHDPDAAADSMLRACRISGDPAYVTEYLCILCLSGRGDEMQQFVHREGLGQETAEKATALCRNAQRGYDESERWLGLKAGLALKALPGSNAYNDFVNAYISAQCRRYGLSLPESHGGPE